MENIIDKIENENKDKFIVYVHITPSNKCYIGTTRTSVDVRWKNGYGYKENRHFWNAIKKYGWDNIKHQWWHVDSEEEMYRQEVALIAKYQTNNPDYGYNKSLGGKKGAWMGKNSNSPEYFEKALENAKCIIIYKTDYEMLKSVPNEVIGKVIKGVLNNTLDKENLSKSEAIVYNILLNNAKHSLLSACRRKHN